MIFFLNFFSCIFSDAWLMLPVYLEYHSRYQVKWGFLLNIAIKFFKGKKVYFCKAVIFFCYLSQITFKQNFK